MALEKLILFWWKDLVVILMDAMRPVGRRIYSDLADAWVGDIVGGWNTGCGV